MFVLYGKSELTEMSAEHALAFRARCSLLPNDVALQQYQCRSLAVACCAIGIPDRICVYLGLIYRQWVMFVLYGKSEVTEMSAEHALAF